MSKETNNTRSLHNAAKKPQEYNCVVDSPWFCVAPNLQIVAANVSAARLVGKSLDEILQKNCNEQFPWCSKNSGCCPLFDNNTTSNTLQFCSRLPNNQTHISTPYQTIGLSFLPQQQQIDGLMNEVQEQIAQLQQQSQIYLDIAGVMVLSINPQGIITSVNKKTCDVLGFDESELLGKNWFEICIPQSIRTEIKGMFYSLLNEPEQSSFNCHEIQLTNRSGELRHVVFTSHLVYTASGSIGRVLMSGVDITAQRIAEYENIRLREHTDMLISMLHDLPQSVDLLLETTAEALLYFSESDYSCVSLLNETEDKIIKQTWSKSVRNECRSVLYEQVISKCLQTSLHQRKAHIENNIAANPTQQQKIVLHEYIPQRLMSIPVIVYNRIVAIVTVVNKESNYTLKDLRQLSLLIDTIWLLVEKLQSSVALRAAEERVRQSERLKTVFLANISHEIRTPMNAILGFSQLLTMSNINSDRKEHFVEQINVGCTQLLNIINDLVEIAKIETGQLQLNETTISINSVLQELHDSFKAQIESKKLELKLEMPLPSGRSNIRVDLVKLVQVLTNLFNNAIKFTNKGFIRLGYTIEDREIHFFVEDSGIGIASENHSLIFERFRQIDMGSNRMYGGVGLGLSIAQAFVNLLGGKMWINSELGIGSIFYFSIPYSPSSLTARVPQKTGDSLLPDLHDKTILVVEDDTANFEFLNALLHNCNAKVVGIQNGLEALEYIDLHPNISLILLDVKLPGIDGLELARRLQTMGNKVPIIAQTANALVVSHEDALNAGCSDYITKPLVIADLLELIVKHIVK